MRTTGPYSGHYLVARAERTEFGWLGYAKVFLGRPASFDEGGEIAHIVGSWVHAPSELDAMQSAERIGREVIASLLAQDQDDD